MKTCLEFAFAISVYLISVYVRYDYKEYEVLSPLVYVYADTTVVTLEKEKSTDEKIEDYIRQKFPERPDIAVAVFKHENGYQLRNGWKEDVVTYNNDGSSDTGISAINSVHTNCGELKDYRNNIDCARKIYDERISWGLDGFSAWYSYVYGKYVMFL